MPDIGSLLGGLGVGGNIGKAIVQLELDTAKYQTEMKTAQASTVAGTNSMGSKIGAFGGIAKTAFLGAGVAAAAFGAYAVNAAIESVDALAKLDNSLKNNARLSDVSRDSFIKQANALRELTGVDDEAVISSQALLGQFDLTGKQVQELIPLIVDLSTKMGIDMEAAAKAVGKATQGSAGILSRYGIVLDETALKTDAFTTVTEGLQSTVGGFAEARAINEPWRVMGAQFEEVAETVGLALLPAIRSLADLLTDLLPLLTLVAEGIGLVVQYVGDLVNALMLGSNGFDTVSQKLEQLMSDLESGKITTGEYQAGINALVDEYDVWIRASDEMKSRFQQIRDGERKASQAALEWEAIMEAQKGTTKDLAKETKRLTDDFEFQEITLEDLASQTKLTMEEFNKYFRTINRESRDLRQAARELADEKWINQDFIDFLSLKGPQWIITFADKNETAQRRMQNEWEELNRRTKIANDQLGDTDRAFERINNKTTNHLVRIKYEYVNFDGSKPGMNVSRPVP